MMTKNKLLTSLFALLFLVLITFLGCSGGGGSDAPAGSNLSPSIQVLPSAYDFGDVTPGNSPAPLEVEIANNGSAGLTVSNMTLSDATNFALDLSGGLNPCNKASTTIAAGDNCTVEVDFLPQSTASFDANLRIKSNDPNNSTLNVPLSGSEEEISELNVRINQVESTEICPNPVVTAYVSVTDQGGYPVTTLTKDDFLITEDGGYVGQPTSTSFVSDTATISVALVMDYSLSITELQDNVDDMEEAAASFVDQLRNQSGVVDEAEIIKFGTTIAVAQDFTSDKALLTSGIYDPLDVGLNTALFDAVVKAVDDIALRSKNRRAVILITDGVDDNGFGNPLSSNDLNDAINYAITNGVPIFTIGLGQQIDSAALQQMANDTGGQYYESTTSDNLRTIYQQLANVLFEDSYILTYNSGLGSGVTANLTIKATLNAIEGDDTKEITACP